MRISDQQIRTLSNLTDWKLKEVLTEHKEFKPAEIIKRAKVLEFNAFASGDYKTEEKMKELSETLANIDAVPLRVPNF